MSDTYKIRPLEWLGLKLDHACTAYGNYELTQSSVTGLWHWRLDGWFEDSGEVGFSAREAAAAGAQERHKSVMTRMLDPA